MPTIGKPVIPKEHGVWPTLLIPLIAGSFVSPVEGGASATALLLLIVAAVAGIFFLEPLRLFIKPPAGSDKSRFMAWSLIYFFFVTAPMLALVVGYDRTGLLWFLVPGALMTALRIWSAMARTQRDLIIEVTGVFGLALSVPAGSYVQNGFISGPSVFLYFLCVIWFLDRTLMARKVLSGIRSGVWIKNIKQRAVWFKKELSYHTVALVLVLLVIGVSGGSAPFAVFLPFLFATFANARIITMSSPLTDPMKVGYSELILGLLFGLFLVVAFRF